MEKINWLHVQMELQGISNTVQRVIAIPDFLSLYYLHILTASLFQFDDLADVRIQNQSLSFVINSDDNAFNEQIFDEIKNFMTAGQTTEFTYTYFGEDRWQVVLTLEQTEQQYQHITCLKAVGNGIFFEQMTKEEYENILQYQQEPESEAAKQFFQKFPIMQELSLTTVDLQAIQYRLSLLERNLFDEDEVTEIPPETPGNANEDTFTNNTPFLDDAFDTSSFLMYLYHEVAGLSLDQAAYEILYRTNISRIIETMEELGYDETAIAKTLQTKIAFEEQVYEKVAEAVDLLQILPPRDEIFTDEEEQYLEAIDDIIFHVLETHGVDVIDLADLNEEQEETIYQQLTAQIMRLKEKHLS